MIQYDANSAEAKQKATAWSHHTPKLFQGGFILKLIKENPGVFSYRQMADKIKSEVMEPPCNLTQTYDLAKLYTGKEIKTEDGQTRQHPAWISEKEDGRSLRLSLTDAGNIHLKAHSNAWLSIIKDSHEVLDLWLRDLYPNGEPQGVIAGDLSLFVPGGIKEVHRTLLLHTLTEKVEDPLTKESRPPYLFEIFRLLESRYGWRSSDAVLSELKKEQVRDGNIKKYIESRPVPSATGQKEAVVELLALTPEGWDRLRDSLLTTYGVIMKTRAILHNWEAVLTR